jgi:hypothetical protein
VRLILVLESRVFGIRQLGRRLISTLVLGSSERRLTSEFGIRQSGRRLTSAFDIS